MHAARAILAADGRCEDPGNYEYLPYFYSRIFDFSWKSYGVYDGDVVHFGEFRYGSAKARVKSIFHKTWEVGLTTIGMGFFKKGYLPSSIVQCFDVTKTNGIAC